MELFHYKMGSRFGKLRLPPSFNVTREQRKGRALSATQKGVDNHLKGSQIRV